MKQNILIPITECPQTPGEWQPSLVPDGYKHDQLVPSANGGNWTQSDHQGFSFRDDLDGLVHHCGGMRIIQTDDGSLYAVQNPSSTMRRIPNKPINARRFREQDAADWRNEAN